MKKTFVLAIALGFFSFLFAGTKKYEVVLSSPTQIGSVKLAPGDYTVKVEGANAVFTNRENDKSVSAPVKVETGNKKFDVTAVKSTQEGDSATLQSIELGGSTTTLEF
jgi:uncharacterized protein (AIM24 family)